MKKILIIILIIIQCSCSFIVFKKKITCNPNVVVKNLSIDENTIDELKHSDVGLKCSMPLL
ncbi:MAG: hypothetical protein KC589_06030 [Nanoarchaeota archaeon]|nr:hypothetical protein [Nanoarchaeota archaeon]